VGAREIVLGFATGVTVGVIADALREQGYLREADAWLNERISTTYYPLMVCHGCETQPGTNHCGRCLKMFCCDCINTTHHRHAFRRCVTCLPNN
jgi:hypothetical protein